jgi:hypothetical protein
MKRALFVLSLATLGIGGLGFSGCGPVPGYSGQQRWHQIQDAQDYNIMEFNEDVDRALMLRPASHMSDWNVIHHVP